MSRIIFFYPLIFWDVLVRTFKQQFSLKRWLLIMGAMVVIPILQLFIGFFRALDYFFFTSFTKIEEPPIFIIGFPRSGTSYLYDVVTEHQDLASVKLYEALFPSLTLIKLVRFLDWLDGLVFHPFRGILKWAEKLLFSGWDNIHPTSFLKKEEDEALFFLTGTSPAINMLSIKRQSKQLWNHLDYAPDHVQRNLGAYYRSSIRRLQYLNKGKRLVIKNVFSSGRIQWLSGLFPNAKFLFPQRTPLKTIPSTISMFTVMYPWLRKNTEDLHSANSWWIEMLVQMSSKLSSDQWSGLKLIVQFKDITENMMDLTQSIFDFLEVSSDGESVAKVHRTIASNSGHKSRHKYSIEDYGITEDKLKDLLEEAATSNSK